MEFAATDFMRRRPYIPEDYFVDMAIQRVISGGGEHNGWGWMLNCVVKVLYMILLSHFMHF